jgi:hypothetical protein
MIMTEWRTCVSVMIAVWCYVSAQKMTLQVSISKWAACRGLALPVAIHYSLEIGALFCVHLPSSACKGDITKVCLLRSSSRGSGWARYCLREKVF